MGRRAKSYEEKLATKQARQRTYYQQNTARHAGPSNLPTEPPPPLPPQSQAPSPASNTPPPPPPQATVPPRRTPPLPPRSQAPVSAHYTPSPSPPSVQNNSSPIFDCSHLSESLQAVAETLVEDPQVAAPDVSSSQDNGRDNKAPTHITSGVCNPGDSGSPKCPRSASWSEPAIHSTRPGLRQPRRGSRPVARPIPHTISGFSKDTSPVARSSISRVTAVCIPPSTSTLTQVNVAYQSPSTRPAREARQSSASASPTPPISARACRPGRHETLLSDDSIPDDDLFQPRSTAVSEASNTDTDGDLEASDTNTDGDLGTPLEDNLTGLRLSADTVDPDTAAQRCLDRSWQALCECGKTFPRSGDPDQLTDCNRQTIPTSAGLRPHTPWRNALRT